MSGMTSTGGGGEGAARRRLTPLLGLGLLKLGEYTDAAGLTPRTLGAGDASGGGDRLAPSPVSWCGSPAAESCLQGVTLQEVLACLGCSLCGELAGEIASA